MKDNEQGENAPYVLTLTILDAATLPRGQLNVDSKVICCVRNRQVNRTHPDVVSVPTQRIPTALAQDILSTSTEVGKQDSTILRSQNFVSNKDTNGHHPVIFAVESLLSRKLGVTSQLEKNEIVFEAALAATHEGIAKYKNPDSEERLQMINIWVHIKKGTDKFPKSTTSFDTSNWIAVKDFVRMWEDGKDVTLAGVNFEKALGVCVDGLCILSTFDILKAQLDTA